MADLINFEHTEAVLREYAEQSAQYYKQKLEESGRRASRTLINSVHAEVVKDGSVIAVDMHLEDYWQYVEYDTRPHWPPKGSLLQWIELKPIIPSPDRNGRIPTPEQLDFLIRRKIAREGTEGTHDLYGTIEELNAVYEERIIEAVTADVGSMADAIIQSFAGRMA